MTIYKIKAIPTVYNHVQFRSRLEARWAAFFDLAGIKWDYEPFDLDGWAPDFLISDRILAEVKPVDLEAAPLVDLADQYGKAVVHCLRYPVLCLGFAPLHAAGIGLMMADHQNVAAPNAAALWREAGNKVQWRPDAQPTIQIVRRAIAKEAARRAA